jgi:D-galactarolactone cycloisomerase
VLTEQPPKLRIQEVRIHRLAGPLKERFGWSLAWAAERHATLVEVRTAGGHTGWGDGFYGGDKLLRHPELVIGRSPFEVEAIFEDLRGFAPRQHRSAEACAGGLDAALWDLAGQALGQPVSELLGKVHRSRVMPYCTALYRKDWPDLAEGLAAEALEWKARGYSVIKMKTGYGPDLDAAIVRAVRDAVGGHTGLAIDSNCAYDAGTAAALGKRLEPFQLLWWEEPVLADDLEGYRRLRQAFAIPLASGETLCTDALVKDYVQPRLVDILQPDIENVGLTGGRRLSYLSWLNHVRLIPHNWGTAIRTASELHWAATIPPIAGGLDSPPVMFEFDRTEHPFRDAVIREKINIEADGLIPVPQGPGLGIHVVEEAVAEYRRDLIVVK